VALGERFRNPSVSALGGFDKLVGKAIYADDLRIPACLHGATVRSQHAHAIIDGIRLDLNYDWSDITVVTAADVPGSNRCLFETDDMPVLAEKVARYAGEPVALIAAPTRARAMEAARRISVDYKPLPALLDPLQSEDNERVIFGSNNLFHACVLQSGDGRLEGAHTLRGTYRVGAVEHLALEPQAVVAIPRDDDGVMLFGAVQAPRHALKTVQGILGHERVNVIQSVIGGSFGAKVDQPALVAAHAALLCQASGRAVRLVYDRQEDLVATDKGHEAVVHITTTVDATGRLQAVEAEVVLNGGAYRTTSAQVLEKALVHVLGPYRCDTVLLSGRAVATHSTPGAVCRGSGVPQVHFAFSRHLDAIARELALDPLRVRRQNLLRPGQCTVTGQVLERAGADAVLHAALEKARVLGPPDAGLDRGRRRLPGRGVAVACFGSGWPGDRGWERAGKVRLELKRDQIRLYAPLGEAGQGSDTSLACIAADALDLPLERVHVRSRDTDRVPYLGPSLGSRAVSRLGAAVRRAAAQLKSELADELGVQGEFEALVRLRKTGRALTVDAFFEKETPVAWSEGKFEGEPYRDYGWHAVVVDVAVDMDTGQVSVRRVVSATDGQPLDPGGAARQIEGAICSALGTALGEELERDGRGAWRGGLAALGPMTSLDAPPMVTLFVGEDEDRCEGVGEIGAVAVGGAVAQAIENATSGVLGQLPMTPIRVLEALV
jgi:CO/xanthine dehydrogenase Mo-binding subunit